jgi:hypothetical protein
MQQYVIENGFQYANVGAMAHVAQTRRERADRQEVSYDYLMNALLRINRAKSGRCEIFCHSLATLSFTAHMY